MDVSVVLTLSPLPVRGQEVESDDIGRRPGRSLLVFGHTVTGRGLLTATGRVMEALVLGETGLDPWILGSPARSWAGEKGRLARRDQQEGAE